MPMQQQLQPWDYARGRTLNHHPPLGGCGGWLQVEDKASTLAQLVGERLGQLDELRSLMAAKGV